MFDDRCHRITLRRIADAENAACNGSNIFSEMIQYLEIDNKK